MRTFLRGIKPDSYFGLLMEKPEMNPHTDIFLRNVLGEFEERLLRNAGAFE